MRTVTVDDLRAIAKGPAPLAAKLVGPINAHAAAQGITTPLTMAHFLAHMAEETDGFRTLVENLNYTTAARIRQVWPSRFKTDAAAKPFVRQPQKLANKVYGGRLGNTAPGDGWTYRGGGAYMLTGRDNYRRFGAAAGIDLERNPELARQPETAVEVAARYFAARMMEAAERDDIEGTTRALNGGLTNIAKRRTYLARAKDVLGASAAPTVPVYRDAQTVRYVQEQLLSLGYVDVGTADGKIGQRTRGAVRLFRADNGLAPGDDIDAFVIAALPSAKPRNVVIERADRTAAEVRERVPEAKQSWTASVLAGAQGIGGAVAAAVVGAGSYVKDAAGEVGAVLSYLDDVPGWLWAIGVAGVSFAMWRASRNAVKAAEDAYRAGLRQ